MAQTNRPWKLVIFDNDGVVVDSEPLASLAMSETLGRLGHPLSPEQCDEAFRGGTLARTRDLVERRWGGPIPDNFEQMYTDALFALMAERLRPVAGIENVLDQLQAAGVPYCLASSGRRDRIRFALETAGLATRFEHRWWGAEDVAEGKPAPDLFLLAAESMGVPPCDCVVVEDAEIGVQAARAAGMAVLGFAAGGRNGALSAADRVFDDMADLPGLLLSGPAMLGQPAFSGTATEGASEARPPAEHPGRRQPGRDRSDGRLRPPR